MLLDIDHLHAYYGKSHILHGVRFTMPEPRIVALLGRNGAGRSTTLKAMMGLVPPSQGKVALNGEDLAGRPAHVIARRGLGYVPEERQVFPNLTVEENLMMGMQTGAEGALAGRRRICTSTSPACVNAAIRKPATCPAANSKCSPSAVHCSAIHWCCWWMNPPKDWRQ